MSALPASPPVIVCLVGPTGVGKSGVALALAERFGGAVVNFDSRQIYRDLALVTAQPSAAEQARCPHFLYGLRDPCRSVSAGEFVELAAEAIAACGAQGRLPLLVGGTGLYLDALLFGLAQIPEIPMEIRLDVVERCRDRGPESLYEDLKAVDPEYAAKIHPRDRQRITRALEVFVATGRTFTDWHRTQAAQQGDGEPRYTAFKIGLQLPAEELQPRLAARIEAMVAAGALEEMRLSLEGCPQEDAPGYSGIGCAELIDVVRGRATMEEAGQRWLTRTRAYAKRQMTWFKGDEDVAWFRPDQIAEIVEYVGECLRVAGEGA